MEFTPEYTRSAQLISAAGSTDLWEPYTPWLPTTGVIEVRGVLIISECTNTPAQFRCRIAIQTAASDIEIADTPSGITAAGAVGVSYGNITSRFFNWDPTISGGGVINTKDFFRIGVIYSTRSGTSVQRGDVTVKVSFRREE